MHTIIKGTLIILSVIQLSCNSGNQAKEKEYETDTTATGITGKPADKPFANIQFASKYDTSCGMPLSAGVEDTLHVNGKIYGFCSKGCKDDFISKLKTKKK